MNRALQSIKNYYFPIPEAAPSLPAKTGGDVRKNLSYAISRVQFQRFRHDIRMWREAIDEAENAFFPHRVKQQRIYQDTGLNEHVQACWGRRKDLTLLRDFKICDKKGNGSDELKLFFRDDNDSAVDDDKATGCWFDDFISYALDAIAYGYSLVSLGDVVNNAFPDLSIIRRQNISPDRMNVTSYIYSLSGVKFMEPPYRDWHIWIPTTSDLGVSKCGYGLFYIIAKTEIYLRNNTGYNADYVEVFGQPIRKGKTAKTDADERNAFEMALARMGSQPYIVLDEGSDEVELVESKNTGTAFNAYGDFEKRMEQQISKVLLGHADAMQSVPGKLGGSQGGEESPAQIALTERQVKDGRFMQTIINKKLLPRMRKLGFPIPLDYHFEFLNDNEDEEFRAREDDSNKKTADIAVSMSKAGLQMAPAYFEERTGIPTTLIQKAPAPADPTLEDDQEPIDDKTDFDNG